MAEEQILSFAEEITELAYGLEKTQGCVYLNALLSLYCAKHNINMYADFYGIEKLKKRVYGVITSSRREGWEDWLQFTSSPQFNTERMKSLYYEEARTEINNADYYFLKKMGVPVESLDDSYAEYGMFTSFVGGRRRDNKLFLISLDRHDGIYVVPNFFDLAVYKYHNFAILGKGVVRQIREFRMGHIPTQRLGLDKKSLNTIESTASKLLKLEDKSE